MTSVGRNSSLFKDEPCAIPQAVRVSDASADLLDFHRVHKERLARFARAKSTPVVTKVTTVAPPEPVPPAPPSDVITAAVHNAMNFIGPRPRDYIHVSSRQCEQPTLRQIMREVIEKYGITELELMSQRRKQLLCTARHEFCWRAKNETGQSFPQIGRFLGDRDHTTIISGVRRFQRLIDTGKVIWPQPKPDGEGEGE